MTKNAAIIAEDTQAKKQIEAFEKRYSSVAVELASLAAFPMTLTTELVCCLRENFLPDAPWYVAADILLSGLCESIGYDLYEMSGAVRRVLLEQLREQPERVKQLEAFMLEYIQYRIGIEDNDRARILGDRPDWTALACLADKSEVLERIRDYLRSMVQDASQWERLYVISMLESYGESILAGTPILQWVERTEAGMDLDETATIERLLKIQLRPISFVTAKVCLDEGAVQADPNARQTFEFETVQVDRRGKTVQRKTQETWGFVESLGNEIGLDMVAIPGGTFVMGSPENEPERYDDESPQHSVKVSPFFIGRYVVTQAQWRVVASWEPVERELGRDPSRYKGDNRPVEQVSWQDAIEFCARLSRETGRLYGLPSEAEWEYACRAGTTIAFNFGDMISPEVANYDWDTAYNGVKPKKKKNFDGTTSVGNFPANEFGLYEMHGNVWEWCEDHWHGDYEGAPTDGSAWLDKNAETDAARVIRGGSWVGYPRYCRSATRGYPYAGFDDFNYGFRVVCRLPRTL